MKVKLEIKPQPIVTKVTHLKGMLLKKFENKDYGWFPYYI